MLCVKDARIVESILPNMPYDSLQHPLYNKHILSPINSAGNGMTYTPCHIPVSIFYDTLITSSFITSFNYLSAIVL